MVDIERWANFSTCIARAVDVIVAELGDEGKAARVSLRMIGRLRELDARLSALSADIAAISQVVADLESPWCEQMASAGDGQARRVLEGGTLAEPDTLHETVDMRNNGDHVAAKARMEEALAASERHFRTLAENLPNYLARHTPDAATIYHNPNLRMLLGGWGIDLAGKTPMEMFPDGRFDAYQRNLIETARTGIDSRLDLSFLDEFGQQRFHQIRFVAERDETGAIASVLSIGEDVTQWRQAANDLKRALDFAQGVVAALPDLLFEVDRDGRYLNVWTKNEALLAAPRDALIGTTVHELLRPREAAAAMEAIGEADRQGVTYGHTIELDLPDGSRRWFEHSLAKKPGETPASDTFLVLSRDVTARVQTEKALDAAHAQLLSVLQAIPDMVWQKGLDGAYLSCNHAFERLTGRRQHEIVGKTDYDLFDAVLADGFLQNDRAAIDARCIRINEEWVTYPDNGERALLETRKVPVFDPAGNVIGVVGVARDVTERRRFDELLANREREFRTLVEHSPDAVVRYDGQCRRVYTNPTFANQLGETVETLLGKTPTSYGNGKYASLFEQKLREVFASGIGVEFELPFKPKQGAKRQHLIRLVPELCPDGTVETVLAVGRDITDLHASRQKIHQMAFYDALTGLPNRTAFNERLQRTIGQSASAGMSAVMMVDVDRFKGVNDTMGHPAGDELLRQAARRLRACVRQGDAVARFGGDEFALLLPDVGDADVARGIARAIIDQFDDRFVLAEEDVFVSCSIGIALYPNDGSKPDDLMKFADSAMYWAKRSGRRGFRFYSHELTREAAKRFAFEADLRHAVERGELELHYQPKVSLRDHEVIGSEALLRWSRPGVGFISPSEFIPVAEETGAIVELGKWVLREACLSAVRWNDGRAACHKVGVNLSARQFQLGNLVRTVDEVLEETGCRPEWLELEITESLLLEEDGAVGHALSALKSRGLTIAIDDFGTGYSALGYLTRFPIDTLKVDRSFVQKATTDRRHGEVVKAILSIARCLGQQVVAEGVETAEQAAFLAANGCDVAQGFLYSKPLPKAEMTSFPRYLQAED